ncbi:MAG: hypothetical protein QM811_20965 [Pirellulales bacterium]
MEIECGSGTYVRSLGRDIAEELGTKAVMTNLVRTAIGPLTLERTVSPDDLDHANLASHLLPPQSLFPDIPRVELRDQERLFLTQGRVLTDLLETRFFQAPVSPEVGSEAFAELPGGRLFTILARHPDGGWAPRTLFPA